MTTDYYTLGSCPTDEDCAQVGSDVYNDRTRVELREFRRMMETLHPIPAGVNARYAIKSFPHDFGTYHELCVVFNDTDEDAIHFACEAEEKTPTEWDVQAKAAIATYMFALLIPA